LDPTPGGKEHDADHNGINSEQHPSHCGSASSHDYFSGVARVIEQQLGLVDDPEWQPRFRQPSRG
jgi:hypothetical protein